MGSWKGSEKLGLSTYKDSMGQVLDNQLQVTCLFLYVQGMALKQKLFTEVACF